MIKLNLKAETKEQELVKAYLQENVSEVLAEKINNGVKIVKENKTLINKKDLNGFMKYAQDEARKLAEKGTNCACVEDKTVYGWAIHYFEEDTIEGTLYNEDGTEYKPVAKKIENKPAPKVEVKKPEKQQATLFDFFDNPTNPKEEVEENEEPDELFEEEKEPPIESLSGEEKQLLNDIFDDEFEEPKQESKVKDFYRVYHEQELTYPDIIVLTKLGDFYEAYNENAKRIASVLDLTLTSQDVGLENRIALAGFPVHIKDKYLEKLRNRYTVLIIEDTELKFYDKIEEKPLLQSEIQTFDKDYVKMLFSLLDGKIEIK